MARSSRGPRQATTWAAEQNPRSLPRIVRLGRPANDNVRPYGLAARLAAGSAAVAAALVALFHWHVI